MKLTISVCCLVQLSFSRYHWRQNLSCWWLNACNPIITAPTLSHSPVLYSGTITLFILFYSCRVWGDLTAVYMFKQQGILGTFQVVMGASGFVSEERINPYRKAMFGNLFDMIKLSCCYHQQLDLFWQLKQSNSLFGCEVFVELCIHIRLFPKIFAHLKVCVYFRINVFVSQSVLIFSILFCPCSFSTFFSFPLEICIIYPLMVSLQ